MGGNRYDGPDRPASRLRSKLVWVFLCGTLSACGGGSEDFSVDARQGLLASGSMQQYAVLTDDFPAYPPSASNARRMTQAIQFRFGDPPYDSTISLAEHIIAGFDVAEIPVDVVDCGFSSGLPPPGFGRSQLRVILDVREQDVEAARALGFVDFAGPNLPLILSQTCTYGVPLAFQRIQGYAKRRYPELFTGRGWHGVHAQSLEQRYIYRRYENGNYLGVVGDDVYVHNGRDWIFLYLGKIQDFIPFIDGIPKPQPASQ